MRGLFEGETIRTALSKLSRQQRQAIAIAYYESRSHAEIATITGLPLGTVHGRIRLGLRHLRTHLLAAGVGVSSDDTAAVGPMMAAVPQTPQHCGTGTGAGITGDIPSNLFLFFDVRD